MRNIVVISAIPSDMRRGRTLYNDISYARFSILSWKLWCERNGAYLYVIDKTRDDPCLPPTWQRWNILKILRQDGIPFDNVAVVDADTIVRPDCPDFFRIASGRFAAVRDWGFRWVYRSIKAFQPLFPAVDLRWDAYFNCGLVVLSKTHAPILHEINACFSKKRAEIEAILAQKADVGTDQTILNFVVQKLDVPVLFLSAAYNYQHCVWVPKSIRNAFIAGASPEELYPELLKIEGLFDFVEMAYVWHFNSVLPSVRALVMAAGMQRIRRGGSAKCSSRGRVPAWMTSEAQNARGAKQRDAAQSAGGTKKK